MKVRIALNVRDPRIVPDMGVKVSFLEAPAKQEAVAERGVRAPADALVQRDGDDVAFVVADDDRVERRKLELGRKIGDDRQVLSGLSAGELVVLDPPQALADGAQVRVAGEDDTSQD